MTTIKEFVVQIEYDERTRWFQTEREQAAVIACLCRATLSIYTEGSIPSVRVVPRELPVLVIDQAAKDLAGR